MNVYGRINQPEQRARFPACSLPRGNRTPVLRLASGKKAHRCKKKNRLDEQHEVRLAYLQGSLPPGGPPPPLPPRKQQISHSACIYPLLPTAIWLVSAGRGTVRDLPGGNKSGGVGNGEEGRR